MDQPFDDPLDRCRKVSRQTRSAGGGSAEKELRGILVVVGVLLVLSAAYELATMRQQVRKVLAGQGPPAAPGDQRQLEDEIVRVGNLIAYGLMGVGVLYFVFAAVVSRAPVPVMVTALVIFLGLIVILAALNPNTLLAGLLWKVLGTAALIRGVVTSLAVQAGREQFEYEPGYDDE